MTKGKLLLTSQGIANASIQKALIDLLGKPISESSAIFVPTALYAFPYASKYVWQWIKTLGELGWKDYGVLELSALLDLSREIWLSQVEEADVIIVGGGNEFYLSFWMERSGMFDLLPQLLNQGKVYMGVSAGTMVVTHSLNFDRDHFQKTGIYRDDEYNEEVSSATGSTKTLALVDFVIRPHLGTDFFPQASLENMEKWAAKVDVPLYALDDQSALKVIDGDVEVISEGNWKLFGKGDIKTF